MTVPLTYDLLKTAVAGSAAAFRLTLKLEAVSPKVFPPTYEGGKYAVEERRIDGETVPCVLLDSVASQANRMEFALQEAYMGGEIRLPMVTVDFKAINNPGIPYITSLQAPHRIVDAILRDSHLMEGGKKVKFRQSAVGAELNLLSNAYATPLLRYAPHSLVFGLWDSTGPRGGLGVKFARAMISEIIGINAIPGETVGGRLDPLNIRKQAGPIYKSQGGWTLEKELADKDPKTKKEIPFGKDGSPAEANHGNIPPALVHLRDKNKNLVLGDAVRPVMMVVFDNAQERGQKYVVRDERKPISKGGFTISHAEQSTVLSLPALRRLRFPAKPGDKSTPEGDLAARTYLAALGLLSSVLAIESGYDLRSRCVLHAKDAVTWDLLGKPGEADKSFSLDKAGAIKIYNDSLAAVEKAKLPIDLKELTLTPSDDLVKLVRKSMESASESADAEDE